MGAEENGVTLEALAQRLETLQQENAERLKTLERENTELRSKVAALEGSGTSHRDELAEKRGSGTRRSADGYGALAFEGRVSRRSLLSKAGAAAVAAVAAGMLLNPREAKANHFSSAYFEASFIRTHYLEAINNNNQWAVKAAATGDHFGAVDGTNNAQSGVGVEGNSSGVEGTGVRGAAHKFGVRGVGLTTGGTGVKGEGDTGVWGFTRRGGWSGVYGQHFGSEGGGYGVVGDGTGNASGVLGRNDTGTGVSGMGSYGGWFEGTKAQLKLKPGGSTGKPSGAHTKGEVYMDKAGALFVCVAGGTPGRWRKVSTTAV